jgi:ribonuclease HII
MGIEYGVMDTMSKKPTLSYERNIFKKGKRYIAGVDEVGRGALAGPVCVCAVLLNKNISISQKYFRDLRDSKQLSPKKRGVFARLARSSAGVEDVRVACVSNTVIDKRGIVKAVSIATERALAGLSYAPDHIFFDGGLSTRRRVSRRTIIKGDEKIFSVALASVCAKVFRDRKMEAYHKLYPQYCFDKHKGYGTEEHCAAIRKNGHSDLHRRSFVSHIAP